MAVSGTRKAPLEALLRRDAPGSAKAAMTEQVLCALADTVVMCAKQGGCPCGRGLQRESSKVAKKPFCSVASRCHSVAHGRWGRRNGGLRMVA